MDDRWRTQAAERSNERHQPTAPPLPRPAYRTLAVSGTSICHTASPQQHTPPHAIPPATTTAGRHTHNPHTTAVHTSHISPNSTFNAPHNHTHVTRLSHPLSCNHRCWC